MNPADPKAGAGRLDAALGAAKNVAEGKDPVPAASKPKSIPAAPVRVAAIKARIASVKAKAPELQQEPALQDEVEAALKSMTREQALEALAFIRRGVPAPPPPPVDSATAKDVVAMLRDVLLQAAAIPPPTGLARRSLSPLQEIHPQTRANYDILIVSRDTAVKLGHTPSTFVPADSNTPDFYHGICLTCGAAGYARWRPEKGGEFPELGGDLLSLSESEGLRKYGRPKKGPIEHRGFGTTDALR